MTQEFQPGQIVYLEEGDTRLYAEVIQTVVSRALCWVRPLLLEINSGDESEISDLRKAFDLIWPIDLFRPALDVEAIALISQVLLEEPKAEATPNFGKQQLHEFINRLWQTQSSSHSNTEQ